MVQMVAIWGKGRLTSFDASEHDRRHIHQWQPNKPKRGHWTHSGTGIGLGHGEQEPNHHKANHHRTCIAHKHFAFVTQYA